MTIVPIVLLYRIFVGIPPLLHTRFIRYNANPFIFPSHGLPEEEHREWFEGPAVTTTRTNN